MEAEGNAELHGNKGPQTGTSHAYAGAGASTGPGVVPKLIQARTVSFSQHNKAIEEPSNIEVPLTHRRQTQHNMEDWGGTLTGHRDRDRQLQRVNSGRAGGERQSSSPAKPDARRALFSRSRKLDRSLRWSGIKEYFGGSDSESDTESTSSELAAEIGLHDQAEDNLPFYRRRKFKVYAFWAIWFTGFAAAGIGLAIIEHDDAYKEIFRLWPYCIFLALLPAIWFAGQLIAVLVIWMVEKFMFTVKNALFFAYAIRRPLTNFIRAVLLLGSWPLLLGLEDRQSDVEDTVYNYVLRFFGCVAIFLFANVLKRLFGIFVELKFNKEGHLKKMQETLRKEKWLQALLAPRQTRADLGLDDDDDTVSSDNKLTKTQDSTPKTSIDRHGSLSLSGKLKFWNRNTTSTALSPPTNDAALKRVGSGAFRADEEEGYVSISIQDELRKSRSSLGDDSKSLYTPFAASSVDSPMAYGHSDSTPLKTANSPRLVTPFEEYMPQEGPKKSAGSGFQSVASSGSLREGGAERQAASSDDEEGDDLSRRRTLAFGRSFKDPAARRREVVKRLNRMERYIRKNALQVTYCDALNNASKASLTNELEAKRIGLYLYYNLRAEFERSNITEENVGRFVPEKDVAEAFAMLDANGNGKVSADECVAAVQVIFEERRNLAASLKNSKSIANSIETLVGVVIHIAFFFSYLFLMFNITFMEIWAFISTVILGLSFIFGPFIRMVFENTMFLFNSHPFDVGDTIQFDGEKLKVEEQQINFTVFLNLQQQRIWIPNQRLLNNIFRNLSKSGNLTESIKVLVDMDTPPHYLEEVVAAMRELKSEIPEELDDVWGRWKDATVPMKITMVLSYDFTHNAVTRSKVHTVVAQALTRLGVSYTWPAMRPLASTGQSDVGAVGAAMADPATRQQILTP